ncbi:hypothetical protein N473_07460 [Pseudoalteromonas luteoviolacea CPMOR-1]|uniref:Tandem-95 repeat protein n=1 Tax=Pseudoalteromonas luteoviolacea CPMOR-1 TaxID=1365248 RepID=A0A162CHW2_9GAMM|nr:cadherin-like domain-containing protein [Pseudoalteromonas luteoviolacea]KZN68254.1 hypothetical protein N473_07460 [Pseudoalteromonas luteoviolacea CPMOR-1]
MKKAVSVTIMCWLSMLSVAAGASGLEFPIHLQFTLKNLHDQASKNTKPVVTSDYVTLQEDGTGEFDFLSNDSDKDKDLLKIVAVSALHGEVRLLPNGRVQYIPAAHFNGQDEITYLLSDGRSVPIEGTAFITVNSVNDAPLTTNDEVTLIANTQVNIDVLANDSDIDGDALTLSEVSAKQGHVLISNNLVQYTPYFDYDGPDEITYSVSDSNGGVSVGRVSVTVLKENKLPPIITAQQALHMDEDTQFDLKLSHFVYSDVDSLPEDIRLEVGSGANYQVKDLTVIPNEHYYGELSVPVTLFDGKHRSEVFNTTLTVAPINDPPGNEAIMTFGIVKGEKFALFMSGMVRDPDIDYNPEGGLDPRLEQFRYIFNKDATGTDDKGWTVNGGRFLQIPGERNGRVEYIPPSDPNISSDYVFFFVYDDMGARSGRGEITIEIKESKSSPVIRFHDSIPAVVEDQPFSLDMNAFRILYQGSFSNNHKLHWVIPNEPGRYTYDAATNLITIDPLFEGTDLNVFVQVSDGVSNSGSYRVPVRLIQVNEAPIVFDAEFTLTGQQSGEIHFRTGMLIDPEAQAAPGLLDRFTYQFMTPSGSADNKTKLGKIVRVPGQPHGVFRYVADPGSTGKEVVPFWVTDEQGLQSQQGFILFNLENNEPDTGLKEFALSIDKATAKAGDSVTLSWSVQAHATTYRVWHKVDAGQWQVLKSNAQAGQHQFVLGQFNVSTYYVEACTATSQCWRSKSTSLSQTKGQTGKKQVIFIHTDLLGSPVAESTN